MRINKKLIIFLLVFCISIGFAYLSANLNINGTYLFKKSTWSIYFDNVELDTEKSFYGATVPTINSEKDTVSFGCQFDLPGDVYKFSVDVINDGTINAQVDTVVISDLTEEQEKLLNVSVKYIDGLDVKSGDVLLAGSRTTYIITAEYNEDIELEDLPTTTSTFNVDVTVSYKNKKSSEITTATFVSGSDFEDAVYNIAGVLTEDSMVSTVRSFKRSNTLDNMNNIVSTDDSDSQIYIWFVEDNELQDGTGILYWYCDANVIYFNEDCSSMFSNGMERSFYSLLTDLSCFSNINTINVTDMSDMFWFCPRIEDLDFIKNWDVSNVTNMKEMFGFCDDLSDISALSNWDVSKVTDIEAMFSGCPLVDLSPIANWDVSNVINMEKMFLYCSSLGDISSISDWNVSNVENMSYMFSNCKSLSDLNSLSRWDVSKVTMMVEMFNRCSSLVDASGINNWGTKLNANLDYHGMFDSTTMTKPSWYV